MGQMCRMPAGDASCAEGSENIRESILSVEPIPICLGHLARLQGLWRWSNTWVESRNAGHPLSKPGPFHSLHLCHAGLGTLQTCSGEDSEHYPWLKLHGAPKFLFPIYNNKWSYTRRAARSPTGTMSTIRLEPLGSSAWDAGTGKRRCPREGTDKTFITSPPCELEHASADLAAQCKQQKQERAVRGIKRCQGLAHRHIRTQRDQVLWSPQFWGGVGVGGKGPDQS